MDSPFVRSWHALALRGIAGILFGAVALFWPNITLVALVLLFGTYSLVDGVLGMLAAARSGPYGHGWLLALEGLLGSAFGLIALFATGAAIAALALLVAFWAVCTGLIEIVVALRLRRDMPGTALLTVAGVISLVLGGAMFVWPAAGALVLMRLLGGYAFAFGTLMLVLALRLRRIARGGHFFDLHPPRFGAA